MEKQKLIWNFECHNRFGTFNMTLLELRAGNYRTAAECAMKEFQWVREAVTNPTSSTANVVRPLTANEIDHVKQLIEDLRQHVP